MPINQKNYHPDWKDIIRPYILKRDGYKCKICKVPNRALITRSEHGGWLIVDDTIQSWLDASGNAPTKIILTIAHLNHITLDNSDKNLAALCQLHHLRHDSKHKSAMRLVAKLWDPSKAIELSKGEGGNLFFTHLLVLARARRNNLKQLFQIKSRRNSGKGKSKYDLDLNKLISSTKSEYYSLVKRICTMLCYSFDIKSPSIFLRNYWSSDSSIIAEYLKGLPTD